MPTLEERYRGALIGLATGDALGATLEFKPPGTFEPISDMVGGGPFKLDPGQWTDDTSMALCLAESLIECNGFDPIDQLSRYLRWKRDGHHSSIGRCFDIGDTVLAALARFERYSEPWSGSTEEHSAGNGSLMRLAPVPLFFAADAETAIARAADSSRTTHGAWDAIDACRYFAGLIVGAIDGRTKDELLAPSFTPIDGLWDREPLAPKIRDIADGSFATRNPPEIRGTGYVVASLEAALWAFAKSTSFEDGALLAVNLGDDADTTGAVYGQIAGAYYGVDAIPNGWSDKLVRLHTLERFALGLIKGARRASA
jgi:ADP-ribosyl-[dinitrogen reductase] hydrolase